ncbi:hypothetical protein ACIQ9J_29060 [Streptomyces sp. NPDC094153]|uniref:hypothetical protein n=1 Tax=Streptomyces sp. NPDC094153 TaxID=3366058 RepID=UPI0037F30FEC
MTEKGTRTSLGPLELTDGRWVMGDPSRPRSHWVELRTDGLYQHEPDSQGQLIPWSRIMPGILFTLGVTGRLALQRPWSPRAIREAVTEARQAGRRPLDGEESPESS